MADQHVENASRASQDSSKSSHAPNHDPDHASQHSGKPKGGDVKIDVPKVDKPDKEQAKPNPVDDVVANSDPDSERPDEKNGFNLPMISLISVVSIVILGAIYWFTCRPGTPPVSHPVSIMIAEELGKSGHADKTKLPGGWDFDIFDFIKKITFGTKSELDAAKKYDDKYLLAGVARFAIEDVVDFTHIKNVNEAKLFAWLDKISGFMYEQSGKNPYHNHIHAADVTLAAHHLLKSKFFLQSGGLPLTDEDKLCVIVAAVIHDLGHNGRANPFNLARGQYPDGTSIPQPVAPVGSEPVPGILEDYHFTQAKKLMKDGLDWISDEAGVLKRIEQMVHNTDMVRHNGLVKALGEIIDSSDFGKDNKLVILSMLLKTADISSVAKKIELALEWGARITREVGEEFDEAQAFETNGDGSDWKKGVYDFSPKPGANGWKKSPDTAAKFRKGQHGFYKFGGPKAMYTAWNRIADFPEIAILSAHLDENIQTYESPKLDKKIREALGIPEPAV